MSDKQRAIKFRIWDGHKMITPENDCHETVLYMDGECVGICERDYGVMPLEYTSLMQFTGLHDCNGKEIYEGDIVTAGEDTVCEVVWKGVGWKAKWYQVRRGVVEMSCHPDLGFRAHEVIGNRFENPELLQESSDE